MFLSFMHGIFYFFLFSLLFLTSCVKNNGAPTWLEVSEWTLIENSNANYDAGILTHDFTDAWVFVDNEIIGVFEVPFKIPILKQGNVNVKVYPTVKNNGISATKKIYPFVEAYEFDTIFTSGSTVSIDPTTMYKERSKFWIEDFEDAAIKLDDDVNFNTSIVVGNDTEHLEYGNFYGHVHLTQSDSIWVAYSNGQLVLPKLGREVYLEVDYKNTNSVITGLLAVTPSGTNSNVNVQMNAQSSVNMEWKKIYIDLKEVVSFYSDATYYVVSFQALLEAGLVESDIYLDNIKVVFIE